MKIYLASGAPGSESKKKRGMLSIHSRLLSYHCIIYKQYENAKIFNIIKHENKQK